MHYLARLLSAGDIQSACRRLMVIACEDVGLAYPQAISIVKSCVDSALMLGLPEARIPLAHAAILLATAPKSNSAYMAINNAMRDIETIDTGEIPRQLQNKHYDGEGAEVKGKTIYTPTILRTIMWFSNICRTISRIRYITFPAKTRPSRRPPITGKRSRPTLKTINIKYSSASFFTGRFFYMLNKFFKFRYVFILLSGAFAPDRYFFFLFPIPVKLGRCGSHSNLKHIAGQSNIDI